MYISSKNNKVQRGQNVSQSDVFKDQNIDFNESKRHKKD